MNERKIHILLAEDDLNLGFLLTEFLESHGYQVKLYRDGESALKGFKSVGFNFCILDVMLPKMDGFTLARNIKDLMPGIPVIFLTARSMKADKLRGYLMHSSIRKIKAWCLNKFTILHMKDCLVSYRERKT